MTDVNLLVVIEAEIATTHLIEQVLRACEPHGVRYRVQFLDKLATADFAPDVLPLFIRCADPRAYSWTQTLVEANYPYLFYIDDNFWRIVGNSPLADYYRHPVIRRSLEYIASHASALISNSQELANFLSQFNPRISVLPTFFDFSLIENISPQSSDEIRIGFAGSPSRADDLELISPLVGPILGKFPRVVFEFAGVMPRNIKPDERVRFFPHTQDYAGYIRFQAERNWAIGLAPLVDHEANRSKTDNKYREYGACGYAGIYSNISPYRDVVRNTETGLLVDNTPAAWLHAITELVADPGKRAKMSQEAREDIRARYDVSRVSKDWADFFTNTRRELPQPKAAFDRRIPWRRNARQRLDRLRLNSAILYRQGGLWLIIRHIVVKLRRLVIGH
ncbi:glycosyltransferase-like protein [Bradyrhizobiaceae bacterium SG-6C]|nr:glycosyltransferase-like protein [Bradyrhizobiaceae bacterium SG-6C]